MKLLGQQEIRESARKSLGKYLNSAGNLVFLRLRCSGEPQEEKKITIFFLYDFFFWKFQEKISFLIYLRWKCVLFSGIYQETTWISSGNRSIKSSMRAHFQFGNRSIKSSTFSQRIIVPSPLRQIRWSNLTKYLNKNVKLKIFVEFAFKFDQKIRRQGLGR
jgi:hypothetical protein